MDIDNLCVIGIDLKAPLYIREMVSFGKRVPEALNKISKIAGISETALLSTCHRSEIYFISESLNANDIYTFLNGFFKIDEDILSPYIFNLHGYDAVEHLFRVTCGLESMVLGEDQILAQVKEASAIAMEVGSSGKVLNELFRDAVALGKRVRTNTHINHYPLSIAYIAVKLAQQLFSDLSNKTAYVIGTGEMGKLIIKYLLDKNINKIFISNRTYSKALSLKNEIPEINIVPYEKKYEQIVCSDIVVSATNAPHYTVNYDKFKLNFIGKQQICMIDIALPRDIDPRIKNIKGVSLFTIDDLKCVVEDNKKGRENQIAAIEYMVDEALTEFIKWYNLLQIVPLINHINAYTTEVCESEYERIMNKFSDIDDKGEMQIEYSLKRVAAKISNYYLKGLKKLTETGRLDSSALEIFKK